MTNSDKTAIDLRVTYSISFVLDGLPRRTNNMAKHWKARMSEARKWKRKVCDVVTLNGYAPETPFKRAKLTLTRHSSQEPDFDGLVSGFKHVIDGLIEAGVIENDKRENIGVPEYRWQKTGRGAGFIEVKVEVE